MVTVSNEGSAPLEISSIEVSGTNAAAFSQSNQCTTLAPGTTCAVAIAFAPASGGSLSAQLSISSNAATAVTTVQLSGQGVTTATWTTLANAPPEGVGLCFLLTDASVVCQAVQNLYRLTPTNADSYVEGAWSFFGSFPSSYIPSAFASAVLADGRLAIIGGEYNTSAGKTSFALSNQGVLFDPVTGQPQTLSPPPSTGSPNHWQCIGDAPATVLADGHWLIGSKLYQDVAVLDPTTLTWTEVKTAGKSDSFNSEEGWTLLPDQSVFTLDVANAPLAERLVLGIGESTGTWLPAGPTPQDLHTPSDSSGALNAPGCPPYMPPGEMGPAVLLPDGTVFAVGADGLTAIYVPSTGTWTEGPAIPGALNVQDGPAALLPSGHVLFGASPGSTGMGLVYYEFDGAHLNLALAPLNASQDGSYSTSLLPLPTGQVLFVDGTDTVQIYSPALSPTYDPAWAPTITAAPASIAPGQTYQISGTQFNGLSQASAYGDESQNATNYPLVRITNSASGHIVYARTHGHTSMGVATGSMIVSTSFDVPTSIESGDSVLEVIANGIPSASVAVVVTAP